MLSRIFLSSILTLSIIAGYSQNFQATIKVGSTGNSVKAVIRPGAAISGQISSVQLTFLVPVTVGTAPTATLRSDFITGINYVQYNATEVTTDGAYYVYTFDGVGGATVPTISFTANAEVDLLEIFFNGNVNTSQVRLAQLIKGGVVGANAGNYNFYLALNGTDRVNQASQFYGTSSFNSGLGYNGYGYALINGVALPFQWLDFSIQKQNGNALIKWEVANQVNNAYYEVEVGKDMQSLNTVGKVVANAIQSVYTFNDININKRQGQYLYYRIKEVDKDGNFTYSTIKKISILNAEFSFSLLNNPLIGDELKVGIEAQDNSTGAINVFDLNGKQVFQTNVSFTSGYSEKVIQLSRLSAGSYIATLKTGTNQYSLKFIK